MLLGFGGNEGNALVAEMGAAYLSIRPSLAKTRELLAAWADYCGSAGAAGVEARRWETKRQLLPQAPASDRRGVVGSQGVSG